MDRNFTMLRRSREGCTSIFCTLVQLHLILHCWTQTGTPVNLEVDLVGPTWIQLTWQPSNGNRTSIIAISYRLTVEPPTSMEYVTNATSLVATGLLPGMTYNFSVIAVSNYEGSVIKSSPSDAVQETTNVTVPAPVCDMAPVLSEGVITVKWSYIHTGGLDLTEVVIQIISSGTTENVTIRNLTETSVDLELQVITSGTYIFEITASNQIGSNATKCPVLEITDTSLSRIIIIGASAGGGGGLILLIVFLIVCIACLFTRRKQTTKQLQNNVQSGAGDQDNASVEYEEIPDLSDRGYMSSKWSSSLPSVLATSRPSIQKNPETSSATESYEELPDIFFKPTSAACDDSDDYYVNEPTSAACDEHDEYYMNEPKFFKNKEKPPVAPKKGRAAAKPPAKGATHQYVNTPRKPRIPQKGYPLPPHPLPHRADVIREEMLYDQVLT